MKKHIKGVEINKLHSLLRIVFTLVPIFAGLDKFLNILTDWSLYISPAIAGFLPLDPATFMMIVGVIEIIAGILVFTKTELGAYIVAAWLTLIALTLVVSWHHADVAVRDLVMAAGAYTLAKLSDLKMKINSTPDIV